MRLKLWNLRIFSDPSPIGELTEVNVAGMVIGKGAELDHSAMLPREISRGQTQDAPCVSGGLVKR